MHQIYLSMLRNGRRRTKTSVQSRLRTTNSVENGSNWLQLAVLIFFRRFLNVFVRPFVIVKVVKKFI